MGQDQYYYANLKIISKTSPSTVPAVLSAGWEQDATYSSMGFAPGFVGAANPRIAEPSPGVTVVIWGAEGPLLED